MKPNKYWGRIVGYFNKCKATKKKNQLNSIRCFNVKLSTHTRARKKCIEIKKRNNQQIKMWIVFYCWTTAVIPNGKRNNMKPLVRCANKYHHIRWIPTINSIAWSKSIVRFCNHRRSRIEYVISVNQQATVNTHETNQPK